MNTWEFVDSSVVFLFSFQLKCGAKGQYCYHVFVPLQVERTLAKGSSPAKNVSMGTPKVDIIIRFYLFPAAFFLPGKVFKGDPLKQKEQWQGRLQRTWGSGKD